MKIQTQTNIWIATLIIIIVAMGITITYTGILEKNPIKTWVFPIIAAIAFIIMIIYFIHDAYTWWRLKQRNKLKATGVFDFINAATAMDDVSRIVRGSKNPDDTLLQILKLQKEQGHEKEVHGVVCDEEIVGYAEGMHLVVTVTRPETAKAFRKLPKNIRKYITVVEVT